MILLFSILLVLSEILVELTPISRIQNGISKQTFWVRYEDKYVLWTISSSFFINFTSCHFSGVFTAFDIRSNEEAFSVTILNITFLIKYQ